VTGPKVSVLIPTCNYARFSAGAVESVLMQEFQNLNRSIRKRIARRLVARPL